jgi:hypothetical protein
MPSSSLDCCCDRPVPLGRRARIVERRAGMSAVANSWAMAHGADGAIHFGAGLKRYRQVEEVQLHHTDYSHGSHRSPQAAGSPGRQLGSCASPITFLRAPSHLNRALRHRP